MSISVFARIRPLLEQELSRNERIIWKADKTTKTMEILPEFETSRQKQHNDKKQYVFSEVFSHKEQNFDIFENVVKDLIDSAFQGKKCSFFVYGQTGSGKTHTMTGSESEEGVIQMAMRYIHKKSKDTTVFLSSFEVYKEQIYDLLTTTGYKQPLRISQNSEGDFEIEALKEIEAHSLEKMAEVLLKSDHQRHFAETYLEHLSSRSHMGFTIRVPNNRSGGSITFIDLAGCERINMYSDLNNNKEDFGYDSSPLKAVNKERFIEGQFINKSVFFLDQVLKKLASSKSGAHIPFRTTTITKILKSSLTGGRFAMCVNPTHKAMETSLNSMNFAIKTKSVSKRKVNTERATKDEYIRELEDKISLLSRENKQLKKRLRVYEGTIDEKPETNRDLRNDFCQAFPELESFSATAIKHDADERIQLDDNTFSLSFKEPKKDKNTNDLDHVDFGDQKNSAVVTVIERSSKEGSLFYSKTESVFQGTFPSVLNDRRDIDRNLNNQISSREPQLSPSRFLKRGISEIPLEFNQRDPLIRSHNVAPSIHRKRPSDDLATSWTKKTNKENDYFLDEEDIEIEGFIEGKDSNTLFKAYNKNSFHESNLMNKISDLKENNHFATHGISNTFDNVDIFRAYDQNCIILKRIDSGKVLESNIESFECSSKQTYNHKYDISVTSGQTEETQKREASLLRYKENLILKSCLPDEKMNKSSNDIDLPSPELTLSKSRSLPKSKSPLKKKGRKRKDSCQGYLEKKRGLADKFSKISSQIKSFIKRKPLDSDSLLLRSQLSKSSMNHN